MVKYIICFLTVRPNELFYNYVKQLKNNNTDIYICIDDNNYNIPNYDDYIPIIKLDNRLCEINGFKSTVLSFNNRAVSRDKALYYFCKNNINYEYIWFIEEDVFIPDIDTINNINNKYKNADLLAAKNNIINQKTLEWHWPYIYTQIMIDLPYSCSMICAIRCSKRLMECINNYAILYNDLFMDEALFNTLAVHNKLDIKTPEELSTIVYQHDWKKDDIKKNYLYHPIKNINKQYEYRI